MAVFRAYDIRGLYPSEVNEELAEKIGKAFGTFIFEREKKENPRIAVAGDVRTSTPSLKKQVIEGLLSTGATVIDIGMVPTPTLYFAVASRGLEGGLVITASHNTKEWNGFKPVVKGGICISWETGIGRIKEIIDNNIFKKGSGKLEKMDIQEDYIKHVLSKTAIKTRKKIVLDAGNGSCSLLAPRVFEKLGWDVTPLFCEPDGNFPNHEADPIKKKNLKHLQEKVLEQKADLGVAYDGDGDRVGIVNELGEIVENNKVFSLFIRDILGKKPHSPVVYEVVVSKIVEDTIKKYGGKPILSRVGHSYIQARMQNEGAVLAGENSGHYYFPENFGYDDSIFASLKVAELIERKRLSEREKEIPDYLTSEEYRPFCEDGRKFTVIDSIQEKIRKEGLDLIDIDGVRVTMDKGWFIIRASNTGPQLVVRWEAEDQKSFEKIGTLVRGALESQGVMLNV